jgi:hypothetical protein
MIIYHADHGLSDRELAIVIEVARQAAKGLFIKVIKIQHETHLKSTLMGPSVGDEPIEDEHPLVYYSVRGNRPGASKMINEVGRKATHLVVIGVGGEAVFTAYGTENGVVAPREPWDASLSDGEREVSQAFWAVHALADQ